MTFARKKLGAVGEELAVNFLISRGQKVLGTNVRSRFGEIDILSRDGQTIVVTEVKTKTSDRYGSAIEMITPAKQRKLVLLTQLLQTQHQVNNVRIDVVTVDQASEGGKIRHYKGVIEYSS